MTDPKYQKGNVNIKIRGHGMIANDTLNKRINDIAINNYRSPCGLQPWAKPYCIVSSKRSRNLWTLNPPLKLVVLSIKIMFFVFHLYFWLWKIVPDEHTVRYYFLTFFNLVLVLKNRRNGKHWTTIVVIITIWITSLLWSFQYHTELNWIE